MGDRSYLSDILVPHSADLLDVCGGLGDSLEGVAGQDQLILLCLGDLDIDTGLHDNPADELLADEVAVDPENISLLFQKRVDTCSDSGFVPLDHHPTASLLSS